MLQVRVRISGDNPRQSAARLKGRLDRAARNIAGKGAHLVERNAKLRLSLTSHPRNTPTPSQPGDPPSLISGTLRRSVKVRGPEKVGPGHYRASTAPSAVYGRIQELGGWTGRGHRTHLPARPYMRPALRDSKPGISAISRGELRSLKH